MPASLGEDLMMILTRLLSPAGWAVSVIQAAAVTLAALSFSLLATWAVSVFLVSVLLRVVGTGYVSDIAPDAVAVLPAWMTDMQVLVLILGMPISIFLSLLHRNSRAAMWFCSGAMAVAIAMVEIVAMLSGVRGLLIAGDEHGLGQILLLLMLMQWLAFRGFLWAAKVTTLAPQFGRS
jgi:hypothetical protein